MPGSATNDILSSGSRNAVGKALDMSTVLYVVATFSRVFISMVCRLTFLGLVEKYERIITYDKGILMEVTCSLIVLNTMNMIFSPSHLCGERYLSHYKHEDLNLLEVGQIVGKIPNSVDDSFLEV